MLSIEEKDIIVASIPKIFTVHDVDREEKNVDVQVREENDIGYLEYPSVIFSWKDEGRSDGRFLSFSLRSSSEEEILSEAGGVKYSSDVTTEGRPIEIDIQMTDLFLSSVGVYTHLLNGSTSFLTASLIRKKTGEVIKLLRIHNASITRDGWTKFNFKSFVYLNETYTVKLEEKKYGTDPNGVNIFYDSSKVFLYKAYTTVQKDIKGEPETTAIGISVYAKDIKTETPERFFKGKDIAQEVSNEIYKIIRKNWEQMVNMKIVEITGVMNNAHQASNEYIYQAHFDVTVHYERSWEIENTRLKEVKATIEKI